MTELRLTLLLGPRETVEAAELAMPDLPHVLAAAYPLEGWDADEVERLLMLAGGNFRQAIMARKHEEPPPQHFPMGDLALQQQALAEVARHMARTPKPLPAEVAAASEAAPPPKRVAPGGVIPVDSHGNPLPGWARDTWGDPTPTGQLMIEAGVPMFSFRVEIARTLAPEAWVEADASLKKADEVLAVIERRRAA